MSKEEKTKKTTSDEDTNFEDILEEGTVIFSTTEELLEEGTVIFSTTEEHQLGTVIPTERTFNFFSHSEQFSYRPVAENDKDNPSSVSSETESSWERLAKESISRLKRSERDRELIESELEYSKRNKSSKESHFFQKLSVSAFLVATGAYLGGAALALAGAGTVLLVKIIMDEEN